MSKREISIVIRAKDAMAAGLAKAGEKLKSFGESAARIGKAFAAAFLAAGTAVAGFAVKALQAFSVQEKAEKSMEAALRGHGDEITNNMQKIKQLASAIQDETGVADENIIARMSRLRMLGVEVDALDQAAKATIALKSAGMSEEAAIKAVALAHQGNFEALQRYIPALKNANDGAEKAAIVNDFLTKGYAQQKAELNTLSGQWGALKGRIGDVWEEFGRAISRNDALMNALKRAGDMVKQFGTRVREWIDGGGVAQVINTVRLTLENMRNRLQKILDLKVEAAVAVITAVVAALSVQLLAASKTSALLSLEMNKASIAAFAKAVALKAAGAAAAGAGAKMLLLKAAMVALQGLGIGAIALGFAAIAHSALSAAKETAKLKKSMDILKDTEAGSIEQWGVGTRTLRQIRLAIQTDDAEQLEKLSRLYPEAVAKAKEHLQSVKDGKEAIEEQTEAIEEQIEVIDIATATAVDGEAEKIKAAEEAAKRMEELAKERADAEKKAAELQQQLQDQLDREWDDQQKKQLADELDANEKKLKAAQDLAKAKIADIIAVAQAEKNAAKEEERDAKKQAELEAREGRGATLSKRQREWLDARRAIQAARADVGQLQAAGQAIRDAQKQLEAQKQLKATQEIKAELAAHNRKLDQLLAWT